MVAGVVALGLLSVVPSSPPASANPGYVQLNIGAMSPQYLVDGCRYKIIYGNFGSAPFAGVRLYGGCSNVTVGVRTLNGTTETWTWGSTVVGTGTDGCGAYSAVQTNGPNPAYATGASIIGNTSFWLFYDYDGTDTQPIHSTC
ncbi:MAG TPA: hypothetical protein VF228_05110 [Iamia sp.]